jgi:hypothetical protein
MRHGAVFLGLIYGLEKWKSFPSAFLRVFKEEPLDKLFGHKFYTSGGKY